MARFYNEKRRPSTVMSDNRVLETHRRLMEELGPYRNSIAKSFIYERISAETGLCAKTVANILLHCK